MLGNHSRMSCGPETHAVVHIVSRKAEVTRLCLRQDWPCKGREFLASIAHAGSNIIDNYGFTANAVERYLENHVKHARSLVSALPEMFMRRQGKTRWVEKTPNHLRHVRVIRQLFPKATIVRIVRDPRDVALSLMNVPWGPRSFVRALQWSRDYGQASDRFFLRDHACVTVRYEDLLTSPVATLRRVCEKIGERCEERMLDTSTAATTVNRCDEPWKRKVTEPADRTRVAAWKRELSAEQNLVAEALLGDRLRAFGYECITTFRESAKLYSGRFDREEEILCLARRGFRFWQDNSHERARLSVFVGHPDTHDWFWGWRPWRVFMVACGLLKYRLFFKHSAIWLRDADIDIPLSKCARLVWPLLGSIPEQILAGPESPSDFSTESQTVRSVT
jgi:hypothetical protein